MAIKPQPAMEQTPEQTVTPIQGLPNKTRQNKIQLRRPISSLLIIHKPIINRPIRQAITAIQITNQGVDNNNGSASTGTDDSGYNTIPGEVLKPDAEAQAVTEPAEDTAV